MKYRVELTPVALRQFETLPVSVQEAIAAQLDALERDARPLGCAPLKAQLRGS